MKTKSNDSLINNLYLFSRSLPGTFSLFVLLFVLSVFAGIVAVALINHSELKSLFEYIVVAGLLTGLLVVMLPTLFTVIIIKSIKRYVKLKHILFVSLIGALVYSVFIILGSAIFIITKSGPLASTVVLVGDASIFALWFFVSKVVFAQRKKAMIFALVQPTLNIMLYIPSSAFLFSFALPLNVLLLKLYAGIFVFIVVSYMILYILDSPMKRNLGFGGVDAFSQIVQDWLFQIDLNVSKPFGPSFGVPTEVETDTVVLKRKDKSIKAIMFAPALHYGPVGAMGGSNFPYLLERHSISKYDAPTLIMHCTVNEDTNPVSNAQYEIIKKVLERGVGEARKPTSKNKISFTKSTYRSSTVSILSLGSVDFATFSRAPKVTEDISPEVRVIFRGLLEKEHRNLIMIDAHNSRIESAPEEELLGVRPSSKYVDEYVYAIKALKAAQHESGRTRVGVGSVDIYRELNSPLDLAPGNLNVLVFKVNGFSYALVHFNCNNILPSLRNEIVKHVKEKFKVTAEVYTTDTHFVNSLEKNASNVLGRFTAYSSIIPFVESAMKEALSNVETVEVYHRKETINRFLVWGPNVREKAFAVINSVLGLARMLVPTIAVIGFIIAVWIISYV